MTGQTISHYRVLEKLGEGGMGAVWKAEDVHMRRVVALKFLHASDDLPRLLREAQTAGSLSHPNICTIHEVDPERGFIAMEYVEGRSLAGHIGGRPLPVEEAVALALQVGEGLREAHEKGITHRDIKSGNIIVTEKGQVKILDFGLARVAGQGALTREGLAAGTPGNMAPEQMRGEPADRRTDIWAFGAVLHEMLTGRPPVGPVKTLPEGLSRIVRKALAEDPGDRYQHIDDLLVDLKGLHLRLDSAAPAHHTRRRLRGWHAVAAALVLLLAGWAFHLSRSGVADRKPISSLAVLPLTNLSGDPQQDWFSDGMTEALIAELSQIEALKVISRTSVMQYRNAKKPLSQIARALNVEAVVEGSALRAGDRVRITAQLIEAETDRHLWAKSYERDLKDVLALQSEVAQAIAREIRVALTPKEAKRLTSARRVNVEAYEAYLRGRFHWYKLSPESFQTALEYFHLALDKDPNYALAYAGIADVWGGRGYWGVMRPSEIRPKLKAAVSKTIELDDALAEGHHLLAEVGFWYEWDWDGAERELRRAIEIKPNYADARATYSFLLVAMKRREEARAQIERAVELDPLNPFFQAVLGWHFLLSGQYDDAISQCGRALSGDQNVPGAHGALWIAFRQKRMYEDALAEAKKFFALLGNREVPDALTRGWTEAGYPGAMRLAARKLAARSKETYVSPIWIAELYADADEKKEAMAWLEKAYEERNPNMATLNVDQRFSNLRDEPRFADLLRRMRLPR
ncbi:MAG: protein kinase [Acidobacteria bacterium]|nr:protein kinase [Acidobacteriota bacterium]